MACRRVNGHDFRDCVHATLAHHAHGTAHPRVNVHDSRDCDHGIHDHVHDMADHRDYAHDHRRSVAP